MSLETPEKIRMLQKKLYLKAKAEPNYRFYLLYDKIYREDVLFHAYELAKSNQGAPGGDEQTFAQIESQGRKESAKLILEPIFEADFEPEAYGYRPKRSAQDAIRKVHTLLCEGYSEVVDADLSKYFDTIPHGELLQCVARRIVDRNVLHLIKMWLQAPVEERDEQGKRRMTGGRGSSHGTPQGGVASPLLANLYMNRFLKFWRISGRGAAYHARVINYADDFVILSRGEAAKALDWTREVMSRLGLTLNEAKTSIKQASRERFDFLGYTFGPHCFRKNGSWYTGASPSKKSVLRINEKVGDLLRSSSVRPWDEVRDQLNRMLRGWSAYFSYGTRLMAYRAVDNHVSQRVREFLTRRHGVQARGTRRFSDQMVFGELGVIRLRHVHLGPPPCALR